MQRTTLGKLLIEEALPEDMRGQAPVFDKKGTQAFFQRLGETSPEKYREVSAALMKVSAEAMTTSGGYSFGLRHLAVAQSAYKHRAALQAKIDSILSSQLSPENKEKAIIQVTQDATDPMEKDIFKESVGEDNPLAKQIVSGAKGNPGNLRSLRGGDLLYEDHKGRVIPVPVTESYSEGLTKANFLNGFYSPISHVFQLIF